MHKSSQERDGQYQVYSNIEERSCHLLSSLLELLALLQCYFTLCVVEQYLDEWQVFWLQKRGQLAVQISCFVSFIECSTWSLQLICSPCLGFDKVEQDCIFIHQDEYIVITLHTNFKTLLRQPHILHSLSFSLVFNFSQSKTF